MTAELNQKEAQLDDTTQAAEKKKQELKSLQAQTKAATGIAVTVQELESMGKKSFTGNIVLTPDECRTLKNYAVSSFAEKAEKLKYQQKYETAKKDAGVWKNDMRNFWNRLSRIWMLSSSHLKGYGLS